MRSRILLPAFFMVLFSGCAASNLVRHIQVENWREEKLQKNEITDIKQVKLRSNGDIYICFVGNQIKSNSDHAIHLTAETYLRCGFGVPIAQRDEYKHKSCQRDLDRSVYTLGCDLEMADGDIELDRDKEYPQPYKIDGQKIRGTNPRAYRYRSLQRLPIDVVEIKFGTWSHVGVSLKYPEPEVDPDVCNPYKGKAQGDQIQIWIPLCDAMYPPRTVIEDDVYFMIDVASSDISPRGLLYKAATFLDVITAPVQWTLCFLTWGNMCSEPPLGPIVAG